MATMIELEIAGSLTKLDVGLEPDEQEWRLIYLSPRLVQWLDADLPTLQSQWDTAVEPEGQFDDLTWAFVSGKKMIFEWQFKPLRYIEDGIWELKTPDLRIFGWFHALDCFVAAVANSAEQIKAHGLYHGHAGEVVRFRDALDLSEPKYVPGSTPHAVVSDFDYP